MDGRAQQLNRKRLEEDDEKKSRRESEREHTQHKNKQENEKTLSCTHTHGHVFAASHMAVTLHSEWQMANGKRQRQKWNNCTRRNGLLLPSQPPHGVLRMTDKAKNRLFFFLFLHLAHTHRAGTAEGKIQVEEFRN